MSVQPHPGLWSPLHRREVSRIPNTRSRTPCALRKNSTKWRRQDTRNVCHDGGHGSGGNGQAVRRPSHGALVPDSSLVDEIAVAAKSRPDHPALITPTSTLTWAEV